MPGQTTGLFNDAPAAPRAIEPGSILVNWSGLIKIVRSRTSTDDGWNCSDGAPISDVAANDPELWRVYSPEQLVADLVLAGEMRQLSGHREFAGGLASWDACSGRPCVLPKLSKLVR